MSGHGEAWWWAAAAAEQEPSRLANPAKMTPAQRASVRDRNPALADHYGEPVQESRDDRAARIMGGGHDFDRLGR